MSAYTVEGKMVTKGENGQPVYTIMASPPNSRPTQLFISSGPSSLERMTLVVDYKTYDSLQINQRFNLKVEPIIE